MKTPSLNLRLTSLLAIAIACFAKTAAAQSTYTWNGGGSPDGNWGTGANWSTSNGSVVPSGNIQGYANFDGSVGLNNTNNFTAGSGGFQIYFKSTGNAFNLYGNSITFYDFGGVDPNIQNESAFTNQTINFPIVDGNTHGANGILNINLNTGTAQGPLVFNGPISALDANVATRAINVSGTNSVTFNAAISDFNSSGKIALTQLGTGTTTLNGTNTFTGDLTISAGTVTLGNAGRLGSGIYAGNISDNGALVISSTNNQSLSGAIIGAGTLTKSGAGALTISGGNSYSGGTTLNTSGTLALSSSNALGTGTLTVGGVSFLQATTDLSGANKITNAITEAANLTVNGSQNLELGGSFTSSGAAGRTLTASNTATTTISGSVFLAPDNTTARGLTLDGPGAVVISGNIANNNFGNTVASALTINNASAVVTLSGSNSFSGATALTAGTINVNSTNAFGASSSIAMNGITLNNTSGSSKTLLNNNPITLGANNIFTGTSDLNLGTGTVTETATRTWTVNGGTLTFGGGYGSAGFGITKAGTGTLALNGALNTTTGTISANAGTLTLGGVAKSITGTLSLNGGTVDLGADLGINNGTLVNGTGGTINATGGGKILLNIAGGDLGVANGGTLTCNAVIANGTSSSIDFWNTASGTGIVNLTADNTFDGTLNLQSGVISVSNIRNAGVAGNLGKSGTINIGTTTSTSTLKYTGTGETSDKVINLAGTTGGAILDQSGTGLLKFTSALTATGGGAKTLTLQGSTVGTGELAGAIVNSGSGVTGISKTGTGTWTLSSTASTYTGNTTVSGGTLNLTGAAGVTNGFFANAGGTLNLTGTFGAGSNNNNFIIGQSSGKGVLNLNATVSRANLFVGDSSGIAGAVYQTGGALTLSQVASVDNLRIGSSAGGQGYYSLSGGTLSGNELSVGASLNGTIGVMDITGGTMTTPGWLVVGRGGTTSSGVLNVSGTGAVNLTGALDNTRRFRLNWAGTAGAQSVVTVSSGGTITGPTSGVSLSTYTLDLSGANVAGTLGAVNLLSGGTIQIFGVTGLNANPTTLLNFNGGTLKATAANTSFITDGNIDAVNIYSGGATIDNNGVAITISRPLLAPPGNGVNGITSFTGGAGYIGAPMVTVNRGSGDTTGTGATAIAQIDSSSGGATSGQVTNIVITNPGFNYTVTPTFALSGGGASTAATITGAAPTANTSGGVTFQGTGTTTIFPGSTYSGRTSITNCNVNADANNTTTSSHFGTGDVAVNGDGTNGKLVLGTGTVTSVNNSTVTRANNFALTNAFVYVQDQRQELSGTLAIGGSGATLGSTYNNQGAEADKGLILSGIVSGGGPITIQHTRIATGQPYNASFVAFNNNANTYSGTITLNENTTTSEGGVYLGIYQPNALANASMVANSDIPGTNLKFGNSPIVFNAGLGSATIGSLAGAAKLVLTEYNAATHVYGANSIALTVGGNNASTTYSGPISGGGSITKMGTGTLTLSATNTYTGNTTISNGVFKLTANGSISNSPTIIVVSNGTFDVAGLTFTLAAGQTLKGTGSVTGNVATASTTASIQPGITVGTLSFSNNLNMSAGGSITFELNTNYNSGNDQVVVGGSLSLSSSSTIHLSALYGAANLDTNADYILFAVSGSTTVSSVPALIWDGTKPANYLYYTVTTNGNNVVLHNAGAIAPTLGAIPSPTVASRNQPVTVATTVTNGSGNIASVTVDLTQIGGSSAANLVLSNGNVYTNTFRVSAGTSIGTKSLLVSVTDDTSPTPLVGTYTITNLVVVVTNQAWNGSGADDNWSSNPNWTSGNGPGYSGDSVTFAGSTRLSPIVDTNYSVTGLTFDNTAGNYGITAANNSALTLTGGITNNSANAQTVNVPITVTGAQTVQANAGNLTFGQNVTNTGTLLTIANTADVAINGVVTNSGSASLLKTGAGKLTLSSNTVWSGSSALGYVPATSAGFPLVAREGTLLFNGGSNFVNGELVIGGVVVNGGTGQNAKIIVDGSTLNVGNWFSVGRGNGTGTVSSDAIFTNGAKGIAVNMSCGFSGGNAANLPKGSVTLSDTSSFTITGNGALNLAESPGSDMTMTLNGSAQFIALGTAQKYLGELGKGTVNLNDSSSMILGNAIANIGYKSGTGAVNVASSATFANAGELRVGGTDGNGPFSGFGSLTLSGGTVSLGSLTIARGNYSGDMISGTVTVNSGTLTSTNDVIVGFRGTNSLGKLVINGGTVNVGTASTKWLYVGNLDNCRGQMDITGGNLNLMNGTAIKFSAGATSTTSTNMVNQSGGTVTFYSDAGITVGGGGDLNLQQSGGASVSNTYNLDGGLLIVPAVSSALTTGTRVFNFNGGTLRAAVSTDSFFNLGAGNAFANVRNGGASIDTAGNNVTVGQALIHSTISGDNAPDGGLTKIGNGTLTLSNANTYTGNTAVNGGTLLISGSIGSGAVGVATNATLRGTGTIAGAVTINSGGTLAMGTTNALGSLTINNTLTLSGTNNFRLNKTGATLTSDKILGTTSITAGGTLNVSTNGGDALASGDSFALFNTGMGSSWFSSVTAPSLATGLSWDTNDVATSGTLDVYTFTTTTLTVSTLMNTAATVSAAKLTAHASSPRGTPVAASASIPGHGTASISAGALTYTPTSGYSGSDTFTVTFQDGHGWQTMMVNVTVNAQNVGPQLTTQSAGGYASFTASGLPSTIYTVQISTNLADAPPFNDYLSVTSAPNGVINYTDSVSIDGHGGQAYYRLKQYVAP